MNLEDEFQLAAPRTSVWLGLNDPEVLQVCIPGCETLERIADDQYAALIQAKVGPLKAKFKTAITLQDVKPPESYTLVAKSDGRAAGRGEGVAKVRLVENAEGTLLLYNVELKVQGKLAQIGSRLLTNVIKKLSNDFFSSFAARFPADKET